MVLTRTKGRGMQTLEGGNERVWLHPEVLPLLEVSSCTQIRQHHLLPLVPGLRANLLPPFLTIIKSLLC